MEGAKAFVYSKWRVFFFGAESVFQAHLKPPLIALLSCVLISRGSVVRRGAVTLGAAFLYLMTPGPVQQVRHSLRAA